MKSGRHEPKASGFRLSAGAVTIGLALAALEGAWLYWFLSIPLPNIGNVGGLVRRWLLLSRALPEVVPGVTYPQSYLGLAMRELSHVENLPQRLPIVLSAALIAAAALALGSLAIRGLRLREELAWYERIPLAFGVGAACLGVITLFAGRLGLLSPIVTRAGLVLMILVELAITLRHRTPATRPPDARPLPLPALLALASIVGPFLGLMVLGAMLPDIDFDALVYHLQGPKEYFLAGRIQFLPHNVYTSMPFNVEMLHLLGMEVIGDWWWGALVGQLLVMLYAPAAAAMIALAAYRWGSPRAAWFATVIYLTTPWIYRLAVLPYVEGPLCYYHAALVWSAGRAWFAEAPSIRVRLWTVVGLLAGGAMACKYPALISAVIPFGLVALVASVRTRCVPVLFAFAAGWAVIMGPWLVKNVVDTGNPVYPLAYSIFPARYWDADLDAKFAAGHARRGINFPALAESILDVVGKSDWHSPLFTAFAPLAFLRRGTRRFTALLFWYVFFLFATWWLLTHRLDRFWLPLLPALAILAGLGADWTRGWAWSALRGLILALAILSNLVFVTTALASLNRWTDDLNQLRVDVPVMLNRALARLDTELPSGAKVLLVGQSGVFHVKHPIVYNTVFNHETIETIAKDRSPDDVRKTLTQMGVSYVYVDWAEVERYRSPGNYGFTPFVTPQLFASLMRQGVLEPVERIGNQQELFRVVGVERAH